MGSRLDSGAVARFRGDGFLFPVRALPAGEAAALLARLEAIEARRAGRLPPAFNAKPHLLLPWLWELVHDARILDPVEDLLGPDILCWGSSFIAKRGRDGRFVSWHQDATHWGLSSPEAVTAWVALTPSRRANGCVRMLPGTHRRALPHEDTRDPLNMLGRRERALTAIDEARVVDVELAPGEMSLHDPLVLHGSDANASGERRVGFAVRYIPGHVRQAGGRRNFAAPVRGRDHGHFERERPPEAEFHPAAVARHREVLRRGMAVIFGEADRRPAASGG
jgi:non-haem Fe2+, alpha-ketoglutarate-dependent halogenase